MDDWISEVENGLCHAICLSGEPLLFFNITERMSYYNVPSVSVAVIDKGELAWVKSYGYSDKEGLKKADQYSIFQAASISKPVAAIASLMLAEEEKINIDEDINFYLKRWQLEKTLYMEKDTPVTIRTILAHTSGCNVHGFSGYKHSDELPSLVQILNGLKPANSPRIINNMRPGSKYQYSGGGYVVLQVLLEDVMGENFSSLMEKNLLSPLGMKDSTFSTTLEGRLKHQACVGYRSSGEKVTGGWYVYPESAAAGLWTTPSDLAKLMLEFQRSLAGKSSYISPSVSRKMLPKSKSTDDLGLGFDYIEKGKLLSFIYWGGNQGFRSLFCGFAYLGKGAVIMTNSDNGIDLIGEILRSIARAYKWELYLPVVKNRAANVTDLNRFVGTYVSPDKNESWQIIFKDTLIAVNSHINYILYPESEYLFFVRENDFDMRFEHTSDGYIIGMYYQQASWRKL